MQTFVDGDGREWQVKLDIPAAREVYQRTKVNLRSRVDLQRMTGDESLWLIPDVLYVLCEEQVRKRYESAAADTALLSAEFGRLLEPCFARACDSLFLELSDFCRRLGMTATARLAEALAAKLRTIEARETAAIGEKMVAAMEAEIEIELAAKSRRLDAILGMNAGNSPAPSGSAASPA